MITDEAADACRKSFIYFIKAIHKATEDVNFEFSPFSINLAKSLQRFYIQSQRHELPNLLLEAPPQHGKSRVAAELFPAWLLGVNPGLRIVVATYTFNLAKKRNMSIQRILSNPMYKKLFPATRLRTGNDPVEGEKTAEGFEVVGKKGSMRFVGVGGSLTGFSADIGIIDDPYKDMAAARSKVQNDAVVEWYNSVFRTRMSKVSGVIMMLTRWTVNDLAGQCSRKGGWKEIKYQAINKEGEALVPALHPIEQLHVRKKELPAVIWEAMYQQNPFIQGGNIIKEEWLQYYSQLPDHMRKIYITGDTAQKVAEHNDYSVFSVWAVKDDQLYWLDMWRGKVTAPGLRDAAVAIWDKWHKGLGETPASGFHIEDKASGTGLIQELRARSRIPVVGIPRLKDKYTRVLDVLNYIQSGRLHLPANAPWTKVAVDEMVAFSPDMKHEHDDIVDTILDGLDIAFGPRNIRMVDVV